MSRPFCLRSSAPVNRRQNTLLTPSSSLSPTQGETTITNGKTKTTSDIYDHHNKKKKKFGEVVGGTAAECAVVCCCFPYTVMNLLLMAVYTVPTGLFKKAWRHRRKRQKGNLVNVLPRPNDSSGPHGCCMEEEEEEEKMEIVKEINGDVAENASAAMAVDLEKEMWDTFYGAGFWRSSSRRSDATCCDGSTSRMLA